MHPARQLICNLTLMLLASGAVPAFALDLYVDKATGQVFAQPGKGREKLDEFKPVDNQTKPASAVAGKMAPDPTEETHPENGDKVGNGHRPTSALVTGEAYKKIRFKKVDLTPGGFLDGSFMSRNARENSASGNPLGNIPLSGTADSRMREIQGFARQSRLSLLMESQAGNADFSGYFETDFVDRSTAGNETGGNSYSMGLRQAWANARFGDGFSLMAGRGWSLITTKRDGLGPQRVFSPLLNDEQYIIGYNWARQFQLRATQDFGHGILGAISLENPTANIGGVVLPEGVAGFGNNRNMFAESADLAPDLIGKIVFEPGWGHWELKALGRFFRDRLNGENQETAGGGVGAAVLLPIGKSLYLIGEGLVGTGIGRYGSTSGADVIAKNDGSLKTIPAVHALGGLEWHPTKHWDVYIYTGIEHYERTKESDNSAIGYGSPAADLTGCAREIPRVCQAANKTLWEVAPGFWYRLFQGKEGIFTVGASYAYARREIWSGITANNEPTPMGTDHMVMVSFRYYLP